jgi:hypothetical protein
MVGLLAGMTNGAKFSFTTSSISIVNGEDVSVGLSLSAYAECYAFFSSVTGGDLSCSAGADASHTLAFPIGSPVFNLPAGWTANSLDGSIVNDMFVPVPEPATGLLVMGGVLGLAVSRRRAVVSA